MKTLAMVLVSLVLAGCGSYTCNCPADGCDTCSLGKAKVAVPDRDGGDAIAAVSADAPCTATLLGGSAISVNRGSAQVCTVRVSLASGVTEVGEVTFQRVSGPCGCALSANVSWGGTIP